MKLTGTAMGILAIVFGILIIMMPSLIRWLLGIYLIIAGILAISRR